METENLHHVKWVTSWRDCLRQVCVSLANLGDAEKIFEGSHDDEMLNYLIRAGFQGVKSDGKQRKFVIVLWREFWSLLWLFWLRFSFHFVAGITVKEQVEWENLKVGNIDENLQIHRRLKCSIIFMSNKIKPKPPSTLSALSSLNIFTSLSYSELRSVMTLPSHFPKVPRVKVYVFLYFLFLSINSRLLILQQFWIHFVVSVLENCLDNNFRACGESGWGVASWRKRNETDGNDKKLIGQYRHQL